MTAERSQIMLNIPAIIGTVAVLLLFALVMTAIADMHDGGQK